MFWEGKGLMLFLLQIYFLAKHLAPAISKSCICNAKESILYDKHLTSDIGTTQIFMLLIVIQFGRNLPQNTDYTQMYMTKFMSTESLYLNPF